MSKDPNFIGQPILSQLLSFIDKREVDKIATNNLADRYTKKFTTYNHLVTMLYCILHKCSSLREVTTGMQACFTKLNHLGMTYCPRRSTLSDANKRRSEKVFEEIYMSLYKKIGPDLSDSQSNNSLLSKLYIIDSTTISLFKAILACGGKKRSDGRSKGGMKVHSMIRADQDVPCLIKMTAATAHDVKFIQNMRIPKGSVVTFDRGYVDLNQYQIWSDQDVTWVTRFKSGVNCTVDSAFELTTEQKQQGVISDELVTLGKAKSKINARRVTYYDSENGKLFLFLTNNNILEPKQIALIYKHRWQIELLFKRFKQNYPLQNFLGDNENALKIQVWCVLIADLILKYIKSKLKRKWSHANLASMIRLHLMSYFKLIHFLNNPDKALINTMRKNTNQFTLFDSA